MGLELFDRSAILTVDTIRMTLLRFSFKITKDVKPKPNKAEIKIYNLNRSHQEQLAQLAPSGINVQLEAGYKSGTSLIFLGTLRNVYTLREGPDVVTSFESGDGEKQYQTSRVNASFAKGADNQSVLKQVAFAVGVAPGNLNDAAAKLSAASVFANGTVCYGSAAEEMTRICRSLGLEWSVQNGKLQILPVGKAIEGKAVRLSEDTGMLGAPTIDPKGTKKLRGVLTVKCLMQPDIFPGRLLVLDAERIKGQYRITQTVHSGDTRTQAPWEIAIQASVY